MEQVRNKEGCVVKIKTDEYGFNPREHYNNLGTIVTAHREYRLGEERLTSIYAETIKEAFADHICETQGLDKPYEKTIEWMDKNLIYLPIYLYDHSGITINTTGFSCTWDSGQLGYIYVEKKKALKEFNRKRCSKKFEKKVFEILDEEVKTYDSYLRGDCWGFIVEDEKGEETDSCWGFLGDCVDSFIQELSPNFTKEQVKEAWDNRYS